MGLAKGSVSILLNECARKTFSGEALTLGKLDIYTSKETLEEVADRFGVALTTSAITLASKPEFASLGYISDESLFSSLGFTTLRSMDYSDFEGADVIHDLNSENAPIEHRERYDLIVDAGTLEHVFHFPNALNNVFQMLKVGGRVVHILPASNMVDHGFYMFSPTVLLDYYGANNFTVEYIRLIKHTLDQKKPWILYDYTVGCLDNISLGGLDSGMYSVACVATKKSNSTGSVIPQQRCYNEGAWLGLPQYLDKGANENSPATGLPGWVKKKINRLKLSLRKKIKGVRMSPYAKY